MKKKTHDWGLTYNLDWPSKVNDKKVNNRQDFSVKLCPKCNMAFELTRNDYKKTVNTHYHEDFPRTGLYHQTCPKCCE